MYYCENHEQFHCFEEVEYNICQKNYVIKRNNINYEISKHIRKWNEINSALIIKHSSKISDSSHYNEYIKENNQELYN